MTEQAPPARSRTIAWADPAETIAHATDPGGLEFLEKWAAGEVPPPPIGTLMNFALVEVSAGRAVFECRPGEYHYNPIGIVHGGLAATLIDSATGIATMAALPPRTRWTTLELNVSYVRPMTKDIGTVRCEGTVIHQGGRVVTSEARLTDMAGRMLAHGMATCLVLDPSGD